MTQQLNAATRLVADAFSNSPEIQRALKEFQTKYHQATGQYPKPGYTKSFLDRAETELAHGRHYAQVTVQMGIMMDKTKSGRAETIEVTINPQKL